eukprot:gene12190-biopygen16921
MLQQHNWDRVHVVRSRCPTKRCAFEFVQSLTYAPIGDSIRGHVDSKVEKGWGKACTVLHSEVRTLLRRRPPPPPPPAAAHYHRRCPPPLAAAAAASAAAAARRTTRPNKAKSN